DDRRHARDGCAHGRAARSHRALRHAAVRVRACRRAADELPPPALDVARARHGVRRRRADPRAVRGGGRGALPLLLLRRCDADPVRTRSANDWREFWATRGERELAQLLGNGLAPHATSIATLL